ncbi:head completion/stabilization protein [Pseudomonas sp. CM25]|uniref:head completion/stabilization protein n=1 Tax=unclassified Pseudomonas TaxID=196821 RepID=UPI001553DF1D|nr:MULTISPECIES: head completion/stabilization protein [unclassified Pseudomonas]NQD54995.1 head completion/stabilization protein [Pseudomonas sp. CM25]NQD77701.1 head completion/stabilization protein [Pseudomonas sp. CM27]HEN8801930.1 head completion/stabilization protein [Pseudomonas putida]
MSSDPRLPRFADCHDPFWPKVDLGTLRERLRLQRQVGDAALEVAARCAVIGAAREFAHWRAVLRARGYKRLADVAGHDPGRALGVCYIRFVEAAVMHSLGSTADLRVPQRRAAHG